ncbi:MAG TPA: ADP-ribosylglycohydrolase family protein, partial [Chroococcales cyanobacterium]
MDEKQGAARGVAIDPAVVKDRIRGAVFGAVFGNSLGGSAIGLNYKEIAATTGVSGLRDFAPGLTRSLLPEHEAGALLADSFLSLSLAESLINNKGKFSVDDLKKRYAALLDDQEFLKSAPGVHCLSGMRKLVDSLTPNAEGPEALNASTSVRSCLMGCLPGGLKSDEPLEVAVTQAQLSSGDARTVAAAGVIADTVRYFIQGGQMQT